MNNQRIPKNTFMPEVYLAFGRRKIGGKEKEKGLLSKGIFVRGFAKT